jgi:hypothetical protein
MCKDWGMDRQALAIGQRFKDIAARPVSEDSVLVLKRHQVYVVDLREILSTVMGSNKSLALVNENGC